MKLHTKYQKPGPSSFREEVFKVFPYKRLCKTNDPWGEVILTPGLYLNILGRGLQDKVTY